MLTVHMPRLPYSPTSCSPTPSSPSPTSWYTAQSTLASTSFHESAPPTEIVPRLYISDLSAAECPVTLAALGITHIVSAMPGTVMLPSGSTIQRLQLAVHDSPFAELAELLPSATSFVANALRDPNARVLVHCVQGVSRSSSVVCAFLIAQYGWTPEQALQYVKTKWRQADPNPGFVSQLNEYALSLRGAPRR